MDGTCGSSFWDYYPEKVDFVESAGAAAKAESLPVHLGVPIGAPVDAIDKDTRDLFRILCLKWPQANIGRTPLEGELVLRFLDERLANLRVMSEEQCPATDLDLVGVDNGWPSRRTKDCGYG